MARGNTSLIAGMITGTLAGAAAALLLAPKPGRVTRRYIRRKRAGYVGYLRKRIGSSRPTLT